MCIIWSSSSKMDPMQTIVLKRFQIGYLQFASDDDLQMIAKHYADLLSIITEGEGLKYRLALMYIKHIDKTGKATVDSICGHSSTFLYPEAGEGTLFTPDEIATWNAYEIGLHHDMMYD